MNPQVKVLSSTTVHTGKTITVKREEFDLPDGHTVERDIVLHPGAAVFIPQMPGGELLLVRQYRHSIRNMLLEFPAGTLNSGEDGLTCAKREIEEETGHRAQEWIDLGTLYPAPGFCNEVQFCYLARKLTPCSQNLDEDEILEVVSLTAPQVEEEIRKGVISDAKSISIFFKAKLKGVL